MRVSRSVGSSGFDEIVAGVAVKVLPNNEVKLTGHGMKNLHYDDPYYEITLPFALVEKMIDAIRASDDGPSHEDIRQGGY